MHESRSHPRSRAARLAAAPTVALLVLASVALTAAPSQARAARQASPRAAGATTPTPYGKALRAQSPNQVYALQLAQTVGRTSVPATVDAVAGRLDAKDPPATIALSLSRSTTALDPLIDQAYRGLLGRAPAGTELAARRARLAGGGSYEAMVDGIVGSRTYVAHHPTLHGQLDALSMLVLGRHVSAAEEAAARTQRRAGVPLQVLAFHVTHSLTYGNRLVLVLFQRVLFRTVAAETNGFWATQVAAGRVGRISLPALLAASTEGQRYGCDPISGTGATCALPWPNDYYSAPDPTTSTGRRVALKPGFLPQNASGVPISPVQPNRSDGFSPGSTIMLQVPGIDLTNTGAATVADLDRSDASDTPMVLLDLGTGARQPVWSELDVHGTYADPATQLLLIHPTRNLRDGHHYVVALRNLKDAADATLPAPPVFAAYRDHGSSGVGGFAARRPHMEALFSALAANGIARSSLYLAWDFTVASTGNLTGRLLSIRDDAFAALGSAAPAFTITSNVAGSRPSIARVVTGTYQVPNYLTGTGAPGATFNEGPDGLPHRNGSLTAPFKCVIPTTALTTAARPSLYGHGLFGSNDEVTAGNVLDMAAEHDLVFCATKWAGMADEDVPTAAGILGDLSKFPMLADRVQQGVLNTLFLGRLMIASGGLTANPAFQNGGGQSVIDTSHLYYDGNSQGGILGGLATAVSIDWTRAVLGVSAINFGLLLPRSTDFNTFEAIMKPAYPDELSRVIGLGVIQLEWDRAEPDGYANHLTTDPLPGTPAHTVLMHIAFGDFQVSPVAADTEARTIGAATNCPSLADGRSPGTLTLWHVPCIPSFPYGGSAIVYWDSGVPAVPLADVPPSGPHDPHSDPRKSPVARQQKSDFLQPSGAVTDVCAGAPCTAPQS